MHIVAASVYRDKTHGLEKLPYDVIMARLAMLDIEGAKAVKVIAIDMLRKALDAA